MDKEAMSYQFHGENEAAEWRKSVVDDIRGIQSDIKTILTNMVTRPEMERYLDRKVDLSDTRTFRDWQGERYQRMERMPVEQREQRNANNVSLATLGQFVYIGIAVAALVISLLKP